MTNMTRVTLIALLVLSLTGCVPALGGSGGSADGGGGSGDASECSQVVYEGSMSTSDAAKLAGVDLPEPDCASDQGVIGTRHDYQLIYLDGDASLVDTVATALDGSDWALADGSDVGATYFRGDELLIVQYVDDPESMGSPLTHPYAFVNYELTK